MSDQPVQTTTDPVPTDPAPTDPAPTVESLAADLAVLRDEFNWLKQQLVSRQMIEP